MSPLYGVDIDVYPTPIDVDVSGRGRAVGDGAYHLQRTGPGAEQRMRASFAGSFGGADVDAAAAFTASESKAPRSARATPAAIAALLPEGPSIREPVSAEIEAGGELAKIDFATGCPSTAADPSTPRARSRRTEIRASTPR